MRSRKNYADWSYQARTNRVKIVGCPNAENRWPDWTVFLFSAFLCWFVWRYVVSIHAPTRGATFVADNKAPNLKFQSTLPRGERLAHKFSRVSTPSFNPRSHEGSDSRARGMLEASRSFNPRSHEGSDPRSRGSSQSFPGVSIHAPTRGATGVWYSDANGEEVSIHAPTRGATR